MNARIWKLAAALSLVASVACTKKDSGHTPAPSAPTLSLTPSATSVVANGANTVTLSVTDTGAAAVTVTTDRGTLNGGVTSYVVPAGTGATTGTVTLTTCDSGTSSGCTGTATVRASSTSGSATVTISFTSLATACQASCTADPACAGLTCTLGGGGGLGTCSASTPSSCTSGTTACTKNPAGAASETSAANGCYDGLDNDCNGKIDCADTACDGQACDPSSVTSVCKSGKCTDLAAGLAITVTPTRVRLPANGTTQTSVVVKVTSNSSPASGVAVSVATTLGTISPASPATLATTKDGTATFTFTASATTGVAVITARPTVVPTLSASASITMPRLGSFHIPENFAVHPVMGVKSSGWNEFGNVAVQVLDDEGQPYPDGLTVHFEHRILGGSTFGEPTATCAVGAPTPCIAYDGVTASAADTPDTEGQATAPLFSGTVEGTLELTASTSAGGATATSTLPSVAVVGAKANGANFSIVCGPRNVPALAETDCGVSWVDAPFTCVALLKDRYSNLLGTSTQVMFASEVSSIGQVAWTPAYDPAQQGSGQRELGNAVQIFQTLGAGLPFDVDPQTTPVAEPSISHGLDGCGTRTHNPRDGVVTVIAIADGEEAFFDANGNGKYDGPTATSPGEPFVDQGEPFVDQNDNGRWDPGEWFLDVNGNRTYDGPNGVWDAQTKIWTQTIVLYTGASAGRMLASAGPPPTYYGTRWVDGSAFTDACVATPAATQFAVKAKITGPPDVPPTSAGYVVVASDVNLNLLSPATTYGVQVESTGKVVVTYGGLKSYADLLGMFYQYWPCDKAGSCSSQCRAAVPPTSGGPQTGPCVMTPAITDFSCGVAAGVLITGGEEPDGRNYVDFLVDVPWNVYLGAKVAHDAAVISGTNL